MPNDKYILFLDTESTGSDVNKDEMIEIGLVLLDADTLEEVDTFNAVITPSQKAFNRMMNNKVVHDMHAANGLIDDLDNGFLAYDADLSIDAWLNGHDIDTTHLPYGGSGVLHFDRKFIDKYLPRLSKRITYWAYDVGVVRRTAAKVGYPWLSQDAKNHRALVDARFHADEFRYAVKAFGRMKSK